MSVSGHSGLPEDVEIRLFEEKRQRMIDLRNSQMEQICKILDTMPPDIRRRFLLEIFRKYERKE